MAGLINFRSHVAGLGRDPSGCTAEQARNDSVGDLGVSWTAGRGADGSGCFGWFGAVVSVCPRPGVVVPQLTARTARAGNPRGTTALSTPLRLATELYVRPC